MSVPFDGGVVIVNVSGLLSTSAPVNVIGRAMSSSTERTWAVAVGVSLTAATVMLIVAGVDVNTPSLTVKGV